MGRARAAKRQQANDYNATNVVKINTFLPKKAKQLIYFHEIKVKKLTC